jgi:hypothetical protein
MEEMKKKASTRQQKKDSLKFDNLEQIFENNGNKVVEHAFGVAVRLALDAKYGNGGLYVREPITRDQVTAMYDAMALLVPVLRQEAAKSFVRIFAAFNADPQLRNFMRRKSAASLGKQGGRPTGNRAAHIEWLEHAMQANDRQHGTFPRLTAKEHLKELMGHPDIVVDEKGNLTFTDHKNDVFCNHGQDEPVITISTVTEMLTRIRKTA